MHYTDDETLLLSILKNHPLQTLNQVVKYARLPRYKVIRMLARFIRFGIAAWKYEEERFVFSLS